MRGAPVIILLALLLALPAPGAGEALAQRPAFQATALAASDTLALAQLESAFQTGNPSLLLANAADPIDIAIFGHGASYSRSQAAVVLLDFFRRHPPGRVDFREEVAAEDRRSLVGRYHEAGGGPASAVFIRLRARDGRWEVRSVRIERGARRP